MDANQVNNDILDKAAAILDAAKDAIQAEMEAKDINASGRTSASLRVERYDGGIRLVIGGTGERTAPLESLEVGRPPGNVPGGFTMTKAGVRDVSRTFKAILVQWARDKGIEGFGWGAATKLGRKIAEQGTARHRSNVAVYSPAVADAARQLVTMGTVTITEHIHNELTGG